MPELPEVETIRMGLEKYLVGCTIEDVEIRLPKIFHGNPIDIEGAKVKGVRRFGKALVIDLDNGFSIAAHIKLTGQFVYVDSDKRQVISNESRKLVGGQLPNKWTHVVFKLKAISDKRKVGDAYLFYNDVRQFGWVRTIPTVEVGDMPFISGLGPEPLGKLTLGLFLKILQDKKTKIKPLLMNQKIIGGIGNIYANDALLLAKIDPRSPANSLSREKQSKLYKAVITVLKRGLKYGGATEINFVNVLGQSGRYQEHFLAYGKEDQPCPFCGTAIKKIRLGGRGTYFCSRCQR